MQTYCSRSRGLKRLIAASEQSSWLDHSNKFNSLINDCFSLLHGTTGAEGVPADDCPNLGPHSHVGRSYQSLFRRPNLWKVSRRLVSKETLLLIKAKYSEKPELREPQDLI